MTLLGARAGCHCSVLWLSRRGAIAEGGQYLLYLLVVLAGHLCWVVRSEHRPSIEDYCGFPGGGVYSGRSNRFNRFQALEESEAEEEANETWLFSSLEECSVVSSEDLASLFEEDHEEVKEQEMLSEEVLHFLNHLEYEEDTGDLEIGELSLLLDHDLWAHGKGCSFYQAELFPELFFGCDEQISFGEDLEKEDEEYLSVKALDESEDGDYLDFPEDGVGMVLQKDVFDEEEIESIIDDMLTCHVPRGGALGSATTAKKRQIQQLMDLVNDWGNNVPDIQDCDDMEKVVTELKSKIKAWEETPPSKQAMTEALKDVVLRMDGKESAKAKASPTLHPIICASNRFTMLCANGKRRAKKVKVFGSKSRKAKGKGLARTFPNLTSKGRFQKSFMASFE